MPRETRQPDQQDVQREEGSATLVPVMFARDVQDAQRSCDLLLEHGIHAIMGEVEATSKRARSSGVPVLVPDYSLDEASEILSARDEENEEEFDSDFDSPRAGRDEDEEDEGPDDELDDDYDDEDEDFDDDDWDDEDEELDDEELDDE